MPIVIYKQVSEDTVLAIWKITESKEELFAFIGSDFYEETIRHENLHWLASRAIIRGLFPDNNFEITKDSYNKPYLKIDNIDYHISITHSFQYAAVIVSKTKNVAIDFEKLDDRIHRVKHKFMRDDEVNFINQNCETEMLTTIWSAKETLYKFDGKKELDFKLNLKIEAFDFSNRFEIVGLITRNESINQFSIKVEEMEGYVLTYIV